LIADPKTGGPKIWQGQNGPGATFEVYANTVRFLSSGRGEEEGSYGASGESYSHPAGEGGDDSIPF
jgi:hypothetical protein